MVTPGVLDESYRSVEVIKDWGLEEEDCSWRLNNLVCTAHLARESDHFHQRFAARFISSRVNSSPGFLISPILPIFLSRQIISSSPK
jgi:hypothetical protein